MRKLFKILVCVHYDDENPVVHRGVGVHGANWNTSFVVLE